MMENPNDFMNVGDKVAVVGVSSNPKKWGSQLFDSLKSLGFRVYPINPKHKTIRGEKCFTNVSSLPEKPDVVMTVTPPKVTEKIIIESAGLGVDKIWMQPGSESKKAVELCREKNIDFMQNSCFFKKGAGKKQSFGRISFACKTISYEDLIRCSFELNKTDYNLLITMMEDEVERTASDFAERMGLKRTTVQKAIKNLLKKQLVVRFRKNLPKGGYIYIYMVPSKDKIKERMREIMHHWYSQAEKEIESL